MGAYCVGNEAIDADVLIVGAGPVGLTLALDLGQRGVRVILIDGKTAPLRLPKMERSNPRTMEIYRRLGIVDRVRAAAYPVDVAMDCFIATSLVEEPLVHLRYPSVTQARAAIAASTDGGLPREPYQLISQYTLEPILLDEVRQRPEVHIRFGTSLTSFTQDDAGVTAQIEREDGSQDTIRARYLAGCDGGSSTVRKGLGIELEGRGGIAQVRQIFFRSDDFYDKCTIGAGRHYGFVGKAHGGAGVGGVIIVQDDRRHFTLQTASPDGTDFAEEIRATTGIPIHVEILYVGSWTQHMMTAERYGEGRVFLAGDANHLYIPAGGLGMNTGIGDAIDLGWKLAGAVAGWGGPQLTASFDAERRPVGQRNLRAVQHAVEGVVEWRGAATEALFEPGEVGASARAAFARVAEPLNRRVYEMHGTELGYRYTSPIVCPETGEPPIDESFVYRPTTFPGARLPHMWQADGTALHDRIGKGFTLLKLGKTPADTSTLEQAIRAIGAPLEVMTIDEPRIRAVYDRDLILVRPDLHVAWRGDQAPEDPEGVARTVTGWN
jgi:2-polyprenyl-6-methoxyphenol hydroxylase-like FAD-dependent oxidoreductase